MTPAELAAAARQANEQDHELGRLPGRYVTDEIVLAKIARLLATRPVEEGGGRVPAA